MRTPNLFLIGSAKGGSSTFASHLNDHPDVAFARPGVKEPNYFSQESDQACIRRLEANPPFDPSTRYILDASVSYSRFPYIPDVPERISRLCARDQVRFLYILRNPVDRAISEYFWYRERYGECAPPEKAMHSDSQYLLSSRYDLQIEQYLRYFSPDQFRYVVFETYTHNVQSEFANICGWLEVDASRQAVQSRKLGKTNKSFTRSARFPALNEFVRGSPKIRAALRSILSPKAQRSITRALSRQAPRPEIDEAFYSILYARFADSISKTEEMTGLNLDLWRPTAASSPGHSR